MTYAAISAAANAAPAVAVVMVSFDDGLTGRVFRLLCLESCGAGYPENVQMRITQTSGTHRCNSLHSIAVP